MDNSVCTRTELSAGSGRFALNVVLRFLPNNLYMRKGGWGAASPAPYVRNTYVDIWIQGCGGAAPESGMKKEDDRPKGKLVRDWAAEEARRYLGELGGCLNPV